MFSFKTIAEAVVPYLDASVADAVNDLADSLDNLVANVDDNDVADKTVAPQDATGPQKGTGRIGWLQLDPSHRFRHLAREVDGGWTDDDDDQPTWSQQTHPESVFTPLLPGFFVAPCYDRPAIWQETDDGPVVMIRCYQVNADFFDAVAALLQTRDGEIAT